MPTALVAPEEFEENVCFPAEAFQLPPENILP